MHVKGIVYCKFRSNIELQNNVERTGCEIMLANIKTTQNGS